jgi:hypothetical protein
MAVRVPPDGYTLIACGTADAINASVYDKLNYNFLRDIAPVGSEPVLDAAPQRAAMPKGSPTSWLWRTPTKWGRLFGLLQVMAL